MLPSPLPRTTPPSSIDRGLAQYLGETLNLSDTSDIDCCVVPHLRLLQLCQLPLPLSPMSRTTPLASIDQGLGLFLGLIQNLSDTSDIDYHIVPCLWILQLC